MFSPTHFHIILTGRKRFWLQLRWLRVSEQTILDWCPSANLQGGKSNSLSSLLLLTDFSVPAPTISLHISRCWCCLVCQRATATLALTMKTLMESSSSAHNHWPVTFIHAGSYSYSHGSTCTTKVLRRLCGEEVGHRACTNVSRHNNANYASILAFLRVTFYVCR